MKKLLFTIMSLIMVLGMLAGCGTGTNEAADNQDEDDSKKITIEIGGDVTEDKADFSYLHVDYFLGDKQCGYTYTCPDQGSDVIRFQLAKSDFEGVVKDANDLSNFRMDFYLSYSDFKGDEAVLQAMYGNTGQDKFLTSLEFPAEYGQTYQYRLAYDEQNGYTLEEVK